MHVSTVVFDCRLTSPAPREVVPVRSAKKKHVLGVLRQGCQRINGEA